MFEASVSPQECIGTGEGSKSIEYFPLQLEVILYKLTHHIHFAQQGRTDEVGAVVAGSFMTAVIIRQSCHGVNERVLVNS